MKKLVVLALVFLHTICFCQSNNPDSSRLQKMKKADSVIKYYQNKRDSLTLAMQESDTALIRQQVKTSTDYFVRLQKENRAKQKKAAMLRIVFGVALFVVLIIGLNRRRKK